MSEFKQIRLNPNVRRLLDDYKMEGESYSIAIGRLFREMEWLEERNKLKDERYANLNEQIRLMKLKETSIKLDEDLLSAWEKFVEDNPEEEHQLNLSDFIRSQMEWTLLINHYIGYAESKEELEEMRKKQRKLKIPQ